MEVVYADMSVIEREKLLGRIKDVEERLAIARVLDRVEAVLETSEPQVTDFLDPAQQEVAIAILKQVPGIRLQREGGYRGAERARLLISIDLYPKELLDPGVTALEITAVEEGEDLTHRDYLGAITGLGLRREKIGDIILIDGGCQVIVADEVKGFLLSNLTCVGRKPVRVSEVDLEALKVEPARVKEIETTVASLRLDSVAGEGFSMSRSKMAREIKGQKVKVNWRAVTDPAYLLKVNDVISIRGRGRVIVESVLGETKKGRIRVKLKRLM